MSLRIVFRHWEEPSSPLNTNRQILIIKKLAVKGHQKGEKRGQLAFEEDMCQERILAWR